jgi:hypothetical protein
LTSGAPRGNGVNTGNRGDDAAHQSNALKMRDITRDDLRLTRSVIDSVMEHHNADADKALASLLSAFVVLWAEQKGRPDSRLDQVCAMIPPGVMAYFDGEEVAREFFDVRSSSRS